MPAAKRARLDMRLVARGLADSREKAQRLILAGAVRVNGQLAHKSSDLVDDQATLVVEAAEKYVSRGGHKLETAMDQFRLSCDGLVCADLGASTGGFTDCLLQRGAARVHAIDVGKGQINWKLRQDPRVVLHDELNARHLTTRDLGGPVDFVTIDVSFISLTKVLPAAAAAMKPGGTLALSLRHGPVPEGRRMFDIGAPEMTALAEEHGLERIHHAERPSMSQAPGVTWTILAFSRARSPR